MWAYRVSSGLFGPNRVKPWTHKCSIQFGFIPGCSVASPTQKEWQKRNRAENKNTNKFIRYLDYVQWQETSRQHRVETSTTEVSITSTGHLWRVSQYAMQQWHLPADLIVCDTDGCLKSHPTHKSLAGTNVFVSPLSITFKFLLIPRVWLLQVSSGEAIQCFCPPICLQVDRTLRR